MGSTSKKNTVCLMLIFLTSRYQSRIDDGMHIDCTSDMINVLEEIVRNQHNPVMKEQLDCVLNDLEELGDKKKISCPDGSVQH